MDKKQAVQFDATFRSTGRGGYDETRLFSLRQQTELQPHRSERSRTGNHGDDIWFLLPGRYIRWSASFSNSGKGDQGFDILVISEDGQKSEPLEHKPDWLPDLPDDEDVEAYN